MASPFRGLLRSWPTLLLVALTAVSSFILARWTAPPPIVSPEPIRELEPRPGNPTLDRRVDTVDFDEIELSDALESFAKRHGLVLAFRDGRPSGPVSLHLKGVTVRHALDCLLASSDESDPVEWLDQDGVIFIASRRILDQIGPVVVRSYDIRNLLAQAERLADRFMPHGYQTYRISGPNPDPVPGTVAGSGPEREKANDLIELLYQRVSPESWKTNGGAFGEISYFNGTLVVRQTATAQSQIEQFLNLLRHEQ
jgi:hypothetical protein